MGLKLSFEPYNLQLKHVFTLANSSRTVTPVVLTKLEYEGVTGFGEASLPPYLEETQESVSRFLSQLRLEQFKDPLEIDKILDYVDEVAPNNTAAKASVDIALHDLTGKLLGKPWHKIWNLNPENAPFTSFTIGIDQPEIIRKKVLEAKQFKFLKIKLGGKNDKKIIEAIHSETNVPLCVDVAKKKKRWI